MNSNELCICKEAAFSIFVQIGYDQIVQVDLQPFLTQSQLDSGFETLWFQQDHVEEFLELLQPLLKCCQENKLNNDSKNNPSVKDCILTGEKTRVACLFKKQSTKNICLLTQFQSRKGKTVFSDVTLHQKKIVAYLCPRASSSASHLSQLVNEEANTDISKYFFRKEAR